MKIACWYYVMVMNLKETFICKYFIYSGIWKKTWMNREVNTYRYAPEMTACNLSNGAAEVINLYIHPSSSNTVDKNVIEARFWTVIYSAGNIVFIVFFSKCFRSGFCAFSTLKYTVKGGTNSCNLWVLKLNTYVMFISGVLVYSVCHDHYWLTDFHWKHLDETICLRFPTKGVFYVF